MSQTITVSIPPATTSGTELATLLENNTDAWLTTNSGIIRPDASKLGTIWLDTSVSNIGTLKMFDGSVDIDLGKFDFTNKSFSSAGIITDLTGQEIKLNANTGIVSGGKITKNSDTSIDIAVGHAVFVDQTDLLNPVITDLNFNAVVNSSIPDIATQLITHVWIDNTGTPIYTNLKTAENTRDYCYLGYIHHPDSVILDVVAAPVLAADTSNNVTDLNMLVDGSITKGGNISENTGNPLSMDIDSTTFFLQGSNFYNNPKTPNYFNVGAQTAFNFYELGGDGLVKGGPISTVNPNQFDANGLGTISPISGGGNNSVIHRLYLLGSHFILLIGQNIYSTFDEASTSIIKDSKNTVIPEQLGDAILLAYLVVSASATDLDSGINSEIVKAGGSFGASSNPSSGVVFFDDLADVLTVNVGVNDIVKFDGTNYVNTTNNQLYYDNSGTNESRITALSDGIDSSSIIYVSQTANTPALPLTDKSIIYNSANDGLVIAGIGSATNIKIANGNGDTVLDNLAGTDNIRLHGGLIEIIGTSDTSSNQSYISLTNNSGAIHSKIGISDGTTQDLLIENIATTSNIIINASTGELSLKRQNTDALKTNSGLLELYNSGNLNFSTSADGQVAYNDSGQFVGRYLGQGSPEGVISASTGSIYQNIEGGNTTSLYVKSSGTGNTGWFALGTGGGGGGGDWISPVSIQGTSTGNANASFINFNESDNTTRTGYIGDASSGDSDLWVASNTGAVKLLHTPANSADVKLATVPEGIDVFGVSGGANYVNIRGDGVDDANNCRVTFRDSGNVTRAAIGLIAPNYPYFMAYSVNEARFASATTYTALTYAGIGQTDDRLRTQANGINTYGKYINIVGDGTLGSGALSGLNFYDNASNLLGFIGPLAVSNDYLYIANSVANQPVVLRHGAGTGANNDRLTTTTTGCVISSDYSSTRLDIKAISAGVNAKAWWEVMDSNGALRGGFGMIETDDDLYMFPRFGACRLTYASPLKTGTRLMTTAEGITVLGTGTSSANVKIYGASTGSPNVSYLGFYDAAGAVQGFIGLNATGDNILRINGQLDAIWMYHAGNLRVQTTSGGTHFIGNITATGSISDSRIKKNVTPISDSLSLIKSIPVYNYDRKDNGENIDGIMMQDIKDKIKGAVIEGPEVEGYDGANLYPNYLPIISHLIRSIQQLNDEIESLKSA